MSVLAMKSMLLLNCLFGNFQQLHAGSGPLSVHVTELKNLLKPYFPDLARTESLEDSQREEARSD